MTPIITSLLDNDLYSYTMQQCVLHHFPDTFVEYQFKCRNDADLTPFIDEISEQIDHLCSLQFRLGELDYLHSIYYLKPSYIEFLRNFKLNRDNIKVYIENGILRITIKGLMFQTILFEVPVLAIVNEVYFSHFSGHVPPQIGRQKLADKIEYIKDRLSSVPTFQFADFGLRRRFSGIWHDEVVATCKRYLPDQFIGTSNVFLAKKYGIKPIGTMGHQLIELGQGIKDVRLSESQRYMLDMWIHEYRGDLGIALSDTLGFDAFLQDFDRYFAKLYDGCRHDSGDPYDWCERLIRHYTKLGIDPMTKTAVFSDGLTVPTAMDLARHFYGRIKTLPVIGTNLTNDCGYLPLQIVIKLVRVNGHPVAKISDSPGKGMCEDQEYLRYLKSVFKIKEG